MLEDVEDMACMNKERKLSDMDCRFFMAKDSIDYDFFELDDIERAVDEAIRVKGGRDVNDDRLSMIAMCQSDDDDGGCDNADDDLVMGKGDLFAGVDLRFADADPCMMEEMQSSAELFNCIAFAEENQQEWVTTSRTEPQPQLSVCMDESRGSGRLISPEPDESGGDSAAGDNGDGISRGPSPLHERDEDSFPSLSPILLENSDLTEVTPCSYLSSRSTPEFQNQAADQRNDFFRHQSKISLLVNALGALKLGQEMEMRNIGLRRLSTTRRNLTFSNDELRRIERENEILLRKITAQSKPRQIQINCPPKPRKTTASVNRLRKQHEIERQNYILFKKIQAAKSKKFSLAKSNL